MRKINSVVCNYFNFPNLKLVQLQNFHKPWKIDCAYFKKKLRHFILKFPNVKFKRRAITQEHLSSFDMKLCVKTKGQSYYDC